jgi:hypothetical protein
VEFAKKINSKMDNAKVFNKLVFSVAADAAKKTSVTG